MKNIKAALITIGVIVGLALALYLITWILDYFFFIFISGLGIMAVCSLFLICKDMLHKEPKEVKEPIAENRIFDKGIEVRTDCESFKAKKHPHFCGDCQTDGHYLCAGCTHIADFESMELSDNRIRYYPKWEIERIERERIELEAEELERENDVTDTNVGEIGANEMAVRDGRYPLFEYMSNNHGLTLLDSEMDEIIDFIKKNY